MSASRVWWPARNSSGCAAPWICAVEFFCSLETNPDFVARWQAAGLRVAALGADGEMRALELPSKRFFIATLFQPQLSSSYDQPHPIIMGYLRACALGCGRETPMTDSIVDKLNRNPGWDRENGIESSARRRTRSRASGR